MFEVADASRQECHPVFVAAVNGVLVPQAATRVNNGRDAGLARNLDAVIPAKREESITRQDGSLQQ